MINPVGTNNYLAGKNLGNSLTLMGYVEYCEIMWNQLKGMCTAGTIPKVSRSSMMNYIQRAKMVPPRPWNSDEIQLRIKESYMGFTCESRDSTTGQQQQTWPSGRTTWAFNQCCTCSWWDSYMSLRWPKYQCERQIQLLRLINIAESCWKTEPKDTTNYLPCSHESHWRE